MQKQEICERMTVVHQQFCALVLSLSATDYYEDQNGRKWNAGKQADHILKSTRPLLLAFRLPNFVLKLIFGRSNRPGRTYDALCEKYLLKLGEGGQASGPFIPKLQDYDHREEVPKKIMAVVTRLNHLVQKKSEEQLDHCIVPHPLLGKITLREMLFFTIFHAEHHRSSILQMLQRDPQEP